MRISSLAVVFACCAVSSVEAGNPSDTFDESNSQQRQKRRNLPSSNANPNSNGFAGEGEVTLLVSISSEKGKNAAAAKGKGKGLIKNLKRLGVVAINVDEGDVDVTMEQLRKEEGVMNVDIDSEVRKLPFFRGGDHGDGVEEEDDHEEEEHGRKLAEETPYGINMVRSKDLITAAGLPPLQTTGQPQKTICVIDTGYALGHPDLPDTSHGVAGFNPYSKGSWSVDKDGHGSHCAGTIGAISGNGIGVASVNPDPTKFKFRIGKGLEDSGWGTTAAILDAVENCVENGAEVISMSLGGSGYSSVANDAYKRAYDAGTLIIAAAGNDGNNEYSYPASYKYVISVAAVNSNRNAASWSQWNDQVEISGPGVGVKSTVSDKGGKGFNYASYSGTSMATPHVAGVATLVWSYFPECSNHQIRQALLMSAVDAGTNGCDTKYGHGIVDAMAAYNILNNGNCGNIPEMTNSANDSPGGCAQYDSNEPRSTPSPTDSNSPTKYPTTPAPTDSKPPTLNPTTPGPTDSNPGCISLWGGDCKANPCCNWLGGWGGCDTKPECG